MEYRDVSMPVSAPNEPVGQSSEANSTPASAPSPDPAELIALRIEEERKSITAHVRQEFEREIQRARAAITTAIDQFAQQRDEYFHQAEDEVVHLALAIARRLIHRESQIDPRLLAGLIRYELDQLEAATSVRLLVSPDTLSGWSELLCTMPRPVEPAADKALATSEARIETALGSTTVSFERELKEIERGFFDLLAHRPASPDAKAVRVQ
jgi:flagellar assembly protein FliH